VYDDFARWRDGPGARLLDAWRAQTRQQAGREPTPSAACLDSPSVKPTERGGRERGDEGGKKSHGRKRPLLGATLGVVMGVVITSTGLADGGAAPQLLQRIEPTAGPRLAPIGADSKYPHHALLTWMSDHRPRWHIEVKTRPAGAKGCTPLENRGGVARTNAGHGRSRRHRKDDARKPESSAAMLYMRHSRVAITGQGLTRTYTRVQGSIGLSSRLQHISAQRVTRAGPSRASPSRHHSTPRWR